MWWAPFFVFLLLLGGKFRCLSIFLWNHFQPHFYETKVLKISGLHNIQNVTMLRCLPAKEKYNFRHFGTFLVFDCFLKTSSGKVDHHQHFDEFRWISLNFVIFRYTTAFFSIWLFLKTLSGNAFWIQIKSGKINQKG